MHESASLQCERINLACHLPLRTGLPLDADTVTDLKVRLGVLANGADYARTFVASNERHLARNRPVAEHSVQAKQRS